MLSYLSLRYFPTWQGPRLLAGGLRGRRGRVPYVPGLAGGVDYLTADGALIGRLLLGLDVLGGPEGLGEALDGRNQLLRCLRVVVLLVARRELHDVEHGVVQ